MGKSLDNTKSYKMHQVYKHQIHITALLWSEVNKMYFHWMVQTELPLLLPSLSCCHNGKIISLLLTHSG